jgi:hypothetical protein
MYLASSRPGNHKIFCKEIMIARPRRCHVLIIFIIIINCVIIIIIIIIIIISMLMPVQQNSSTHLRVLLVLADRGILAQSN